MRKLNESFVCVNCDRQINPAPKTARNHCPYCFTSLHVDGDIPGDRNTQCGGVMKPIEYDFKMSGKSRLLFVCMSCGKHHRNKVAEDDCLDLLVLERL